MKKLLSTLLLAVATSCVAIPAHAQCWQTPFGMAGKCPDAAASPGAPTPTPAPVAPAPFRPTYEVGPTMHFLINGQPIAIPLNEWYFASASSAAEMCKRLACSGVFLLPIDRWATYTITDATGATIQERYLAFADGSPPINAGNLASYFTRNPEDKFPGLAMKLIAAIRGK